MPWFIRSLPVANTGRGGADAGPTGRGSSFITLFNGNDLAGWHGQETADPRKFAALSGDEKAEQLARDVEDLKEH